VTAEWIQFAIVMLTFLAFLLRNEHRITVLEEQIIAARITVGLLDKRVDRLESKLK
jgi:hypothetical protein